ncbi:MAG: polyprenyl synthetase family protein [Syntrophobacterales bacterium]|nr:polyprenyl synthetase family protein [Syntrophobacterales bacterium]
MDFDLKAYVAEKRKIIDEALDRYLPPVGGMEGRVVEAARYSLFAGGKRLRPILSIAAHEACGGSSKALLPVACALEMIHTYSLIHDDLPAMDNDDFRRGKPTNHKVFGEAVAILAGDLLLTYAFELMAEHALEDKSGSVIRAIYVIAKASGLRGMVGGQMIDLVCEGQEVDLATVEYMHARKTGALITASVQVGAILSGTSESQIEQMGRYGRHLGLAFQITDDLLDITGSLQEMGKTPGSDIRKGKRTYPLLVGIEESKRMAKEHVKSALSAISDYDEKADPLRAIAKYVLERSK